MPRTAVFETTMGTFKAELYTEQMPITWYVYIMYIQHVCAEVSIGSCPHSFTHSLIFSSILLYYSGNFIDLAESGFYNGIVSIQIVINAVDNAN